MADTPSQPPGWPYDQEPNQNPAPPPRPQFEPPPPAQHASQPPPPGGYPPSQYEPPYPASPPPPGNYQPPAPGYGQVPPPPGGGWAPQQPPSKSSTKKILLWVGAIMAVLALAVGSCSVWFYNTVTAPVDESNRFLAAIDQADYESAAAMTDPACNRGMTAADLEEIFEGRDISYDLKSSNVVNSSATVSGSFSAAGISYRRIELSLRNNDGWAVCSFRVS